MRAGSNPKLPRLRFGLVWGSDGASPSQNHERPFSVLGSADSV